MFRLFAHLDALVYIIYEAQRIKIDGKFSSFSLNMVGGMFSIGKMFCVTVDCLILSVLN